jgi:predicted unusual protein kinase regulating ubiquinone biosynthesis (AarF/ABC1/UbiB family)
VKNPKAQFAVICALLLGAVVFIIRKKIKLSDVEITKEQVKRLSSSGKLAIRSGLRAGKYEMLKRVSNDEAKAKYEEEFSLKTAEDVVNTLGNMKGALMKLGQLASFVDDGLPDNVKETLAQLQTNAPPMSFDLVKEILESQYNTKLSELFIKISPVPLAAASIGQVHLGITRSNEPVALKVQYPMIAQTIEADLKNMNLAGMLTPFIWKGLDLASLTEELKSRLLEEVDYELEARNQQLFYEFYKGHPFILIPKVYPEFTTKQVLCMQHFDAMSFQEAKTMDQNTKNAYAEIIYRFAFRSLYRLHAFNGDPHPGNYLFTPDKKVIFLDYGLVKYFSEESLRLLEDIIVSGVLIPNVNKLRIAVENAGFLVKNAPVSDEDVWSFMEAFLALVKNKKEFHLTSQYASEISRRVIFGRASHASVVTYANIPKDFAILQRINLGLIGVLAQLNATANWRGVSEEIWPFVDSLPQTKLGEIEASWWASKKFDRDSL